MAKNIFDTLFAVGGIAGEYEPLTEADITAGTGAAYAPPEEFGVFRVVASRVIQLLGGAPIYIETFQTSAFNLRVPYGAVGSNDAQDGRIFFIKNSGVGAVTIDTSGVGTSGIATVETLEVGKSSIILHGEFDSWDSLSIGSSSDITHYRYSNDNGVPFAGTRYYRTGEGVRTSSVGDYSDIALTIRSITSVVDTADTGNTYNVQLLSDSSGSPSILATLVIDGNNGRFETSTGLAVSIPINTEFGIRVVLASGTGASSFSLHNISVILERA